MTSFGDSTAGDVVDVCVYRLFVIQVQADGAFGKKDWISVSAGAFTDVRNPGAHGHDKLFAFMEAHRDVTLASSRVTSKSGHPNAVWLKFSEQFAFSDVGDARRCAERLGQYARWAHAWKGDAPWQKQRREEQLFFRVVEINHASTMTVVETYPIDCPCRS